MKKIVLFTAIAAVVFGFSSCTKEQNTINVLHGTWKLTSRLDAAGNPPVATSCTAEELVTFFLCDDKEQNDCEGTTKVTTTCTIAGTTTTNINAGRFSYAVFGKEQMVIGSTNYEIESIKKKELIVHPTEEPLATHTYEKQ